MLPVLLHRFRRISASTLTWLERAQHLLSKRWLIVLVAHYYERDSRLQIDVPSIRSNLDYLSEQCNVLPLQEALHRLEQGKSLPRRAVSLVVDDAALPFYEAGWPLLRDSGGTPFSLAVISGLIRSSTTEHLIARIMYGITSVSDPGSRRDIISRASSWLGEDDQRAQPSLEGFFTSIHGLGHHELAALATDLEVPDEEYMTWDQLAELRSTGLVELVSHSMSHPRFRHVTGAWLEWELSRSRQIIQDQTGEAVNTFVFPYGSPKGVTEPVRNSLKRNGYRFALLTKPGIVTPRADRFLLPRIDGEVPVKQFRRNVSPARQSFSGRRRAPWEPDLLSRPCIDAEG